MTVPSSTVVMAEAPTPPASPAADLDVALDLLVDVVGELTSSGRILTGSGVRLALKDRTYGGFDLKSLGFRRFRDFLDEAATRGRIEVDDTRLGDVGVRIPGITSTTAQAPAEVRGDLWRAFLEWTPSELRLYDREHDSVVRLPREPAPLEPEKFGGIRRRMAANPDAFVTIHPITRRQQVEWMHRFADTRTSELRLLLTEALAAEKPAKTFVQVLRALPEERARWNDALLLHVRARVEEWRDSNSLVISIDKRPSSQTTIRAEPDEALRGATKSSQARTEPSRWLISGTHASPPSSETALAALTALLGIRRGRADSSGWWSTLDRAAHDPERELKRRLHIAIDRMPVDDLRKLAIPVGYLFED